jgi:hypothetical protein
MSSDVGVLKMSATTLDADVSTDQRVRRYEAHTVMAVMYEASAGIHTELAETFESAGQYGRAIEERECAAHYWTLARKAYAAASEYL